MMGNWSRHVTRILCCVHHSVYSTAETVCNCHFITSTLAHFVVVCSVNSLAFGVCSAVGYTAGTYYVCTRLYFCTTFSFVV